MARIIKLTEEFYIKASNITGFTISKEKKKDPNDPEIELDKDEYIAKAWIISEFGDQVKVEIGRSDYNYNLNVIIENLVKEVNLALI